MKTYDAIVVGAGHNGLTTAAFLQKAGLDVVCVEKNDYIGGATVSRNLYKDWFYSNCSYVCSLLRPEIYRDLELARHGLQVTPYGGGAVFMENGDYLGSYSDEEGHYREYARFSQADADAYERYSADVMRQCRFIREFLLRTPPDPASFRPRDLKELGLVDEVVPEPLGGAHNDLAAMAETLKVYLLRHLHELTRMKPDARLKRRYEKFRAIGHFIESTQTPETAPEK